MNHTLTQPRGSVTIIDETTKKKKKVESRGSPLWGFCSGRVSLSCETQHLDVELLPSNMFCNKSECALDVKRQFHNSTLTSENGEEEE